MNSKLVICISSTPWREVNKLHIFLKNVTVSYMFPKFKKHYGKTQSNLSGRLSYI